MRLYKYINIHRRKTVLPAVGAVRVPVNDDEKVLEAISKPHLVPDGYVENLFKMLTYSRVCCAFSSVLALPSNAI
jgi:hypothetical protein